MEEAKIKLTCSAKGVADQEFEKEHAERLLGMTNNGGWKLPKDSPYKFTDNALTRKTTKGKS